MDAIRLLVLTGCLLSAMLGGLYATAGARDAQPAASQPDAPSPVALPSADAVHASEAPSEPSLPTGVDVPAALMAVGETAAEEDAEVFVDAATGVTMGPLTLRVAPQRLASRTPTRSARVQASEHPLAAAQARRASSRPLSSRPAEMPRLDPDPGRHVILTARGMMSRGETVRGSCYAYLTEVFDRAGHDGWRTRSVIHQAGASGPYANLDQIRPGDWLYIVNNPDATPMGTHSVLFLGWEDRANGYARTISHAGWAAGASPGREGSHDVTRTYRIIRPRLAD